jgi:hypothetical protein
MDRGLIPEQAQDLPDWLGFSATSSKQEDTGGTTTSRSFRTRPLHSNWVLTAQTAGQTPSSRQTLSHQVVKQARALHAGTARVTHRSLGPSRPLSLQQMNCLYVVPENYIEQFKI